MATRRTSASNNNDGAKAFGGVVALIAVIAGVYAMVEPMAQRIDFLERQLAEATTKLEASDTRGCDITAAVSTLKEKFLAVEAQFGALRDREDQRADMTIRLTDLRRSRAKDEHRAMMKECRLRMDDMDRRLYALEGQTSPPLRISREGMWKELFGDAD